MQYVKLAVSNVKEYLSKKVEIHPDQASAPLSNTYRPEIDISEDIGPQEASYHQSFIGIICCIVELGHVDIFVEVFMISSQLLLTRRFHIEQVLHMFGYLKKHHNAEMVFGPSEPSVAHKEFKREDWSSRIYVYIEEEIPPNTSEPRGLRLRMRVYVDSNHTGDSVDK